MRFCQIIVNCSLFAILGALLVVSFTSNATLSKSAPEYKGVDPKAAPYVDEYLSLAKSQGIFFTNTVTVGFKDLKDVSTGYRTVGLSNYGQTWREIDLDVSYWSEATSMSKKVLLFHELSHSYCDRLHDYGEGKSYGEAENTKKKHTKETGFFDDGCPLSLMYPVMVHDDCSYRHYDSYVAEIFKRCKPY